MQYADALAAQVQNHEITEADAMAKFAEYKTRTINDVARNDAIVGAGIAASSAASRSAPSGGCWPSGGTSPGTVTSETFPRTPQPGRDPLRSQPVVESEIRTRPVAARPSWVCDG